ncbi:hypothetical protein [Methylomonas koyamae]|uniref:hypothetical protein n=1 Tax=Methylomonas koyamae TaxID=702114 RepID=UPI0021B217CA|nr:hypothetical protein [Methylomonas koyamae]
MSLFIASMTPDRALEDSTISQAITKIAIALAGYRQLPVQKRSPALDIVFMLPGSQERAAFAGLRIRGFDQTGQSLQLEAAVPDNMIGSAHAERYVIAVMQDAIDAGAEFFREQQILFDAAEHLALSEALAEKPRYAIN